MEGLTDRDYQKWAESLNIADAGTRYELAKGDTESIEWEMEDFCESHGYKVVKGTPAYKKLAYAFLKATAELFKRQISRHRGEIVETPKCSTSKPSSPGLNSLSGSREVEAGS